MALLVKRAPMFVVVGLVAVLVWRQEAVAQSSVGSATPIEDSAEASASESQNEAEIVDGPVLLNANEPEPTGAEAELPKPATGAKPDVGGALPEAVPAEPTVETPDEASAAAEALPPPRQPSAPTEQRARSSELVLGLTLDVSPRGIVSVRGVEPESLAARAGLQRGDVIWAINDERIRSVEDARDVVAAMQPGEVLEIDFARDLRTQVVLDERAVRTAGYAEERDVTAYDGVTYRGNVDRDNARYGGASEDLPLPAYTESGRRDRPFFYAPDASDSRSRYDRYDVRRPEPEDDRGRVDRRDDDQDRRFFRRPLLRWWRN